MTRDGPLVKRLHEVARDAGVRVSEIGGTGGTEGHKLILRILNLQSAETTELP